MKDRKPNRAGAKSMNKTEFGPVERNAGASERDASLGKEIQSKIGDQLRAIYDDVVSEGVPDRFADLLKRLDRNDDGTRS